MGGDKERVALRIRLSAGLHVHAERSGHLRREPGDDRQGRRHRKRTRQNDYCRKRRAAADAAVNEGSATTVSFTAPSDAAADVTAGFKYSYDFNNDGDFLDTGEATDVTTSSRSFTFADSGAYIVHGRIKDKDGAFTDYT